MEGIIDLSTGKFTVEELDLILKKLPFEISFVGADDTVRFFSDKPVEERLFLRSKPSLGKDLRVCHPKKYIEAMQNIMNALKSGAQSHARFWRQDHQGKFISIDYYALRDSEGIYKGALEVVQDITDLKKLEGDRHEVLYL
jgi:uncharacterized protein